MALLCVGCSLEQAPTDLPSQEDADEYGTLELAASPNDPVSSYFTSTCSTAVVRGLSLQLIEEVECLRPNSFKSIEGVPGLSLSSAVIPFLQAPAVDALAKAQKSRGTTMAINSALRTLPQQFLLYNWFKRGRCGITAAANPGSSNHESGVAIDIDDYSAWTSALQANQYRWFGNGDKVHFDYVGDGAVSIRGLSVQAFQRLWNRNHPEDLIKEDGDYGPATADRVALAPVGGFAKGAVCTKDAGAADTPPFVPGLQPDAPEAPPELGEVDSGCCAVTPGYSRARSPRTMALGAAVLGLLVARRRRSQAR